MPVNPVTATTHRTIGKQDWIDNHPFKFNLEKTSTIKAQNTTQKSNTPLGHDLRILADHTDPNTITHSKIQNKNDEQKYHGAQNSVLIY